MIAAIRKIFGRRKSLTDKVCQVKESSVKTRDVENEKAFCALKTSDWLYRKVSRVLSYLTSPGFFMRALEGAIL